MPEQPNIILIQTDQWRGDCLGVAGHPVVDTPFLDGLALSGARFTKAYAAHPTCIPSRASLLTGLSARSHGRIGYRDGVPWDYPVTLAGEFTRHGYQTQAVGKMHVYPERSQMGFQNVVLHDGFLHAARRRDRDYALVDDYTPWLQERLGPGADYFEHGVNCNSHVARPWDKPEHLHPTNWVVTQGIDFLRRRDPRKPFFLYLSFHRPHPPFDPPAWAFEQYLNSDLPAPPVGDWAELCAPYDETGRPTCRVGTLKPDVQRRAQAGYYGHITHIDHQINRFLEALQEFRLREDAFVMFTSDHGELMGDHHLHRKSFPYEGSARVPMLLKGPDVERGGVHNTVVEQRDIMPTLLECAGLPIPESIEGRSFLPFARGETTTWRDYLHGEHTLFFGGAAHWLTDGREKYIWLSESGHEQLFDLHDDPQELHDLAPHRAERVTHWRNLLIQELSGREEGFTDGTRLIPGRPVSPTLSFLGAHPNPRTAAGS